MVEEQKEKFEHIAVKDLASAKVKFRFLNTQCSVSYKTNYDWYLAGKPRYGLMKRDETNKLKTWDNTTRKWVDIDENQFWYEVEGKKKTYLDQIFSYFAQLEVPALLSLQKGKKQVQVDRFYLDASYAQDKVITQHFDLFKVGKFNIWQKQGTQKNSPFVLIPMSDVPQALLDKNVAPASAVPSSTTVAQPVDIAKQMQEFLAKQNAVDVVTPDEQVKIDTAKKNNMTADIFKNFMMASGMSPERIAVIMKHY